MGAFIKKMKTKNVVLPKDVEELLNHCKSVTVFNTTDEIAVAAVGGKDSNYFEVKYDIPGKGVYTEAIVHKVKNGVSANFTEQYMRRRDPDTMVVADNLPTDKTTFQEKYGYDFSSLKEETFKWLKEQDLSIFFYFAGRDGVGSLGIAVVPSNAGFFAMGLSMLQAIVHTDDLTAHSKIQSILYIAPPFRHTHFQGKQVVVHYRNDFTHEMYAYNLYPGPSAKKGLYGVLLNIGEKENWITTHCSTVQAISPYDNITTYMHEGASGGGKSEMLQHIVREPDGSVLVGENILTKEKRTITIPRFCDVNPVTDDMALCPPSIQKNNGKLTVMDAENAWFIRVDSCSDYGDDPTLEKITIKSQKPLLFLNIETTPDCTALIWDHIEDAPGKKCPNPRVIVPKDIIPNAVNVPVSIDVRSFGVRAPMCSRENPSYGIVGIFHILPPALAWLWRLVAPRGFANPSITGSSDNMESEGVGSYWPFATGKQVHHANMLLEQIMHTPNVRYALCPNQHIGVWKVGFKPQLLMREYLTRRGNAKLRADQIEPARCSLLGYELTYLTIEGAKIPTRFLKVHHQIEVGKEGYDAGAKILSDFFKQEVAKFVTPELHPIGSKIIELCMKDASIEDYIKVIPME